MLVRSCNGRERLPCAWPCTIASGDGATACAGNATISSDARGTCTLPVTVTAGSSTSMVRSGVAKTSASARCTMRTASPRSVRRVGQPASASSVVVPAIVSTPSPACPVASICSTRPSLLAAVASIMSTTSPQRGTLMRPFDNAARPSTVGSLTVPATSRSTASAPDTCSSSGDSKVRKPRSGHSTRRSPRIIESRASTSAIAARKSTLPPAVLRTVAARSARPAISVMLA